MSECRDSKAFDVGVPILDTDRGGLTSLDNVVLSRAEGILYVFFFFGCLGLARVRL